LEQGNDAMAGSEQDNFACEGDNSPTNPRSSVIAQLNDQLRCHARGGQVAITSGVIDLGQGVVPLVLEALRNFDQFSPDNDPYGERDFGALTVLGHHIFWKIDYYDRNLQFGSPDPADPAVTTRVLTIMLAGEY
jgi:hypothetical protein